MDMITNITATPYRTVVIRNLDTQFTCKQGHLCIIQNLGLYTPKQGTLHCCECRTNDRYTND